MPKKKMPERPPFIEQLQAKWNEGKFVSVGLDPLKERIPKHLTDNHLHQTNGKGWNRIIYDFLTPIIDTTGDLVASFKPNIAFFEAVDGGLDVLEDVIDHIRSKFPDVSVIGDVKRADIGNTNRGYAEMAFERFGFDAITVNPYFGPDTYEPFLRYPGKGLIILCKTTNPGASVYQDAPVNIAFYQEEQKVKGIPLSEEEYELAKQVAKRETYLPLYYLVALRTATLARENPNIGLVVGATHPEAFKPIRQLTDDTYFLIPGIGTQGGDLEKTLKYAPDSKGQGMIINSGSAIIFASSGEDFAEAARAATLKLHQEIVNSLKNE